MVSRTALALCASSVAFGATSDVTITGLTGAQQTLRPISFLRVFQRGEIGAGHFAKPVIALLGTPAVWQNDVRKRHRDGPDVVIAITGATNPAAPAPIRITAASHGLEEGQIVTIAGVGGNTAANGTFTIRNISTNAFDLINSTGNGAYTSGGTATGASLGSLWQVQVTFRATIPASGGGSVVVSFSDTADQCSSGNTAVCNAASLDKAGMLAFNGGWVGTTQTVASGITHTADARDMIDDENFTYWLRGPAATVVVAEDASTARAYDFGYTCTVLCTPNYAVTGAPNASPIVVTAATNDFIDGEVVNVMNLVNSDGNFNAANGFWTINQLTSTTFELVGSVAGTSTLTPSGDDRVSRTYNLSTWTDDVTNRSLHPIFVVSFFTGWAGVKIEYIMENVWTTAIQDQFYALTLSTSAGAVYTHDVTQYAWTRWHRSAWDGSEPGGAGNERAGIKVDLNLPYLIQSKIVLPYDLTMDPGTPLPGASKNINLWISQYAANTASGEEGLRCGGVPQCGNILYAMEATAGRGDIGPISSWGVAHLYTFSEATRVIVEGDADNVGLWPEHMRESQNGRAAYDQAGTVPSFGKFFSVNSRPTLSLGGATTGTFVGYAYNTGNVGDRVTPLAALSRGHKWNLGKSHEPSIGVVAYLITGDWWHLSNILDLAQNSFGWATYASEIPQFRPNGYPDASQTRTFAWSMRDIFLGSVFSPDGTPEQNYITQKLNNTIAYQDGVLNNTASRFYDPPTAPFVQQTETSQWGLGNGYLLGVVNGAGGWPNPLGLSPGSGECSDIGGLDPAVIPDVRHCGKPFFWFFTQIAFRWMQQNGYPVDAIRTAMAPYSIQGTQDPAACTFCASAYNMGTRPGNLPAITVTGSISSSVLTIPLSSIPADWHSPPFMIYIGPISLAETVKICAVDAVAANAPGNVTACSGTHNGRGFGPSTPRAWVNGDVVESRKYFADWASQKTGFEPPYPNNFAWIGGDPDSYALYLQATLSGYVSATSGGYTGLGGYNILQAEFLANAFGQVQGANNDPKFKFSSDPDPGTSVPVSFGGRVSLGGNVVIH